jgi:metal-dependent hydrolase (beta-lactamase superfamily II)
LLGKFSHSLALQLTPYSLRSCLASAFGRDTVAALKDINPDYVIPMHCSGEIFIDIVQKEMPDKFIRSYTGSRYIFSA